MPVEASSLKVGIQLPEVEWTASWADHVEMARVAEEAGFDSLWLGDHLLYPQADGPSRGPWECLTMLTGLAAVTTRVELGPLVLATSFRSPALTAKMAATIDEISGGRLILGLGAGWNRAEYDAFGFPFDHRVDRFAEAFEIIRRSLAEPRLDYTGMHYASLGLEILPKGPRSGAIPLMIGSVGERMLRITLPHVTAWNMWYADYGNSPAGLMPYLERIDRICREVDRDPATLQRTVAVLVTAPGGGGRRSGAEKVRDLQEISGSPETVAAALAAFAEAGIDHVQVVLDPITSNSIVWLGQALEILRG